MFKEHLGLYIDQLASTAHPKKTGSSCHSLPSFQKTNIYKIAVDAVFILWIVYFLLFTYVLNGIEARHVSPLSIAEL